jgi:SOS response regulatory protein OraA/RecX
LIKKKERQLKKDTDIIRNQKILRFVLSKGFESSMIIPLLKETIVE